MRKRLKPGATLEFRFPDLPPTLWARTHRRRRAARMLVCLPRDYRPDRQFPMVVFLGGGDGAAGTRADADYVRKVVGNRGFIGVSLPLFKKDLDRTEKYGGILLSAFDDYPLIARCYRRMLGELLAAVPNIAPGAGAIGGFSNGGHTTALLLSAVDPFILKHFRSFFLLDGGFFIASLHKSVIGRKRILHLVGGSRRKAWRRWLLAFLDGACGAARKAGRDVTLLKMPNVEHAFPDEYIGALRKWLRQGTGGGRRRVAASEEVSRGR